MVVAIMSIAVQASELDYAAVQTVDGQVVARVQLAPDATVVLDGPLGTVHATWRAGGKGPVVVLAWVTAAGTRGQRARVSELLSAAPRNGAAVPPRWMAALSSA